MIEIAIAAIIALIFGSCVARGLYCMSLGKGDYASIYFILSILAIFVAFNLD